MDILTVDEERAILAVHAAKNATDAELQEFVEHEWLGPHVRAEIARRELDAAMPSMPTVEIARMLDTPGVSDIAERHLEARRGRRLRREEFAEQGVSYIG